MELEFVYEVHTDISVAATIRPVNPIPESVNFDTLETEGALDEVVFEVVDTDKSADFYFLHPAVLVFSERVYRSDLATSFEFAGEIVPLKMKGGEKLYLLNIVYTLPLLDYEKSKYGEYDELGEPEILKAVYDISQLECVSSLFKIPENASKTIYCTTYADEHDFYRDYHAAGFTGLKFTQLLKMKMASTSNGWELKEVK
jgi:hypothetical protein